MTQLELPKEFSRLLDPPENLNKLNIEACNQLMDKIICFYGMTGQPDLVDKLLPAYQVFLEKVHPALRFQTYQNVVDLVIKEEIGLHGLLPFLCGDVDPTIVSSAALDYIVLCPVEQNDAMQGPNELLEMIDDHVFLNPMAVISGLLMSGDSRVLNLLVPIRKKLNYDQA
ncbi:MAG: hypothetical protein JRF07_10160, partial [Deltaproteobacteria bacterium]|nr:hypothetical protein [Deltaproteobacteria bacterium]